MHPRLLLLVAIGASLAGCSSADDAAQPSDQPPVTTGTDVPTNETAPIIPEPPVARTYWLDERGLAEQPPAPGSVPLHGLLLATATWNLDSNEFHAAPATGVLYVTPQVIDVTLVIESDVPAAGNQAFDIAIWLGSTASEAMFQFTTTGPVLPGTPMEVTFSLDMREHPGLMIPLGEALLLRVADSYQPEGAGVVRLLTGEEGSRVELLMQNRTDDPFLAAESSRESFTGTVTGGAFASCNTASEMHAFDVGENSSWLRIDINVAGATQYVDLDLDLMDGDTILWHAGSPRSTEQILLAGPSLEPLRGMQLGTRASMCFGGHQTYEIIVTQG